MFKGKGDPLTLAEAYVDKYVYLPTEFLAHRFHIEVPIIYSGGNVEYFIQVGHTFVEWVRLR